MGSLLRRGGPSRVPEGSRPTRGRRSGRRSGRFAGEKRRPSGKRVDKRDPRRDPRRGVGRSCPDPNMFILMADGSQKKAGNLKVGDLVKTYHEKDLKNEAKLARNKALVLASGDVEGHSHLREQLENSYAKATLGEYEVEFVDIVKDVEKIKLSFEGSEIVCSLTHKFYINNSWKEAKDMVVGDKVSDKKLLSIENVEDGDVVHITVKDAHTYICEGLLSHNKRRMSPELRDRLNQERPRGGRGGRRSDPRRPIRGGRGPRRDPYTPGEGRGGEGRGGRRSDPRRPIGGRRDPRRDPRKPRTESRRERMRRRRMEYMERMRNRRGGRKTDSRRGGPATRKYDRRGGPATRKYDRRGGRKPISREEAIRNFDPSKMRFKLF